PARLAAADSRDAFVPRRRRERTVGALGRRFGARVVFGPDVVAPVQSDDAWIAEASERTYCAPRRARSGRRLLHRRLGRSDSRRGCRSVGDRSAVIDGGGAGGG